MVARLAKWATLLQPFFLLAVAALLALGFVVESPRAQLEQNQREHTVIFHRLDNNEDLLRGIARGMCVTTPERDRQLLGLNCSALLTGRD